MVDDAPWPEAKAIKTSDFDPNIFEKELNKVSNRTFSSGGLENRLDGQDIHYEDGGYAKANILTWYSSISYNPLEKILLLITY